MGKDILSTVCDSMYDIVTVLIVRILQVFCCKDVMRAVAGGEAIPFAGWEIASLRSQ